MLKIYLHIHIICLAIMGCPDKSATGLVSQYSTVLNTHCTASSVSPNVGWELASLLLLATEYLMNALYIFCGGAHSSLLAEQEGYIRKLANVLRSSFGCTGFSAKTQLGRGFAEPPLSKDSLGPGGTVPLRRMTTICPGGTAPPWRMTACPVHQMMSLSP